MRRGKRAKDADSADKENIKKVSGKDERIVDTNKLVEATNFTTGKRKSGTAFINEFEPNTCHDSLSKRQCTQNVSNQIYQIAQKLLLIKRRLLIMMSI